jgi:thioredoxin-related protein
MNMKTLFCLIALMAAVSGAVRVEPPKTYQEAAQLANKQNKMLFLLFHKDECPWCDKMFEDTMSNRTIRQFLGKYFICYYVDRDVEPGVVKAYKPFIKGYPFYCFVSMKDLKKPIMISHISGYKNVDDFTDWYNSTVAGR